MLYYFFMKTLAVFICVLAIIWFSARFFSVNYADPSIDTIQSTRMKEKAFIDSATKSQKTP